MESGCLVQRKDPCATGRPGDGCGEQGMIRGIHHLGLTVRDVDASRPGMRKCSASTCGRVPAPAGLAAVFLRHDGLRARLGLTQHRHGSIPGRLAAFTGPLARSRGSLFCGAVRSVGHNLRVACSLRCSRMTSPGCYVRGRSGGRAAPSGAVPDARRRPGHLPGGLARGRTGWPVHRADHLQI